MWRWTMDEEFEQLLQTADVEVYRAKWTQAARETYFKEHPENFAGPDMTYPIKDGSDVDDAWRLAGHGANPDKIRSKIKSIAKRLGLSDALPDTAKEEDGKGGKGRAMETDVDLQMYVPITRIDENYGPEKLWMVEGRATSDQVDSYGTIFDYDSSKRAFEAWEGNVREMHQLKAVGRAIEWWPDEDNHAIMLRAFVSKGEPGTWEKVKDGTLRGFSIGVPKGGYKLKQVERNGKSVPMFYDHKLAEVSIVDVPGSPGCDIAIVRADGMITEVLNAPDEPQNAETSVSATEELPEQTRAGQRISHVTQDALHNMRDNHLRSAKSTMELCVCEECMAGCKALDPDGDGDIDLMPTSALDWDSDGGQSDMMADMRTVEAEVTRILAPTLQRYNAIAAQLAQLKLPEPSPVVQQQIDLSPIERRLETMEQLVPGIAEVRSLVGALGTALNEVKELAVHNQELAEQNRALAEQIASMPQGGGPIANSAAMEKILATQGVSHQQQPSKADVARMASQYGLLTTEQSQLAGATAQIAEVFNRSIR